MGSRYTERGAESVYAAAEAWKERALLVDDSLFTPGKAVWTAEMLEEVHGRFLDQEVGFPDFYDKLKSRMDGSPPEVYQLVGEALYVHYLPRSTKSETKKSAVETVLGWSPEPINIPPEFVDVFQAGFINLGPGNGLLNFQLGVLIEAVEHWKKLPSRTWDNLLKDEWAFKNFVFNLSHDFLLLKGKETGDGQLHLLLHILFPDTFERIFGRDKGNICKAKAFAPFFDPQEGDIDRKIQQIRQSIEEKKGGDFDFYDKDIRQYWKPEQGQRAVENFDAGENLTTPPTTSPATVGLQSLADQTYLPVSFLKEIESLLAEKRQVIFQGPPGTGKTYVAQKLARHLAGSGDDAAGLVRLVQFHPSYAYEDFVQGFRPKQTDGNQVGFELRKGPLLEIAEKARNSDKPHYLIIDEINRGNLASVFGELYFLLEYRDTGMRLQYSDSDEDFKLPENLFIIGTMNTADRSIAMVDLALRRRFYFVEFHPEKEPVNGVLREWLRQHANGMRWVAAVVDKANELLKDSDAAIGPSYFMREGLNAAGVKRIWKHSVLPYIAERLFDDRERLAGFDLDKLIKAVSSRSEDGDVSDTDEAGNGGE